jgi:hypothetical protein
MNANDIAATRAALNAAIAGLEAVYAATTIHTDSRIEDLLVGVIEDLHERLGDLNSHAEQIEADRAPWFARYEAA